MPVAEDDVSSLASTLAKTQLSDHHAPAAPTVSSLAETLEQSPFTIFGKVEEVGFFQWRRATHNKQLKSAKLSDFLDRIKMDENPPQVLPVATLNKQLPLPFARTGSRVYCNKFPFSHASLPPLYYAVKKRAAGLDDIDFVFGGSTMSFFVTQPSENDGSVSTKAYSPPNRRRRQYVAMFVPGTKAIWVTKHHAHSVNMSDKGYQVERLASGRSIYDENDLDSSEHLQVIDIGPGYRTLVCAVTDGIDSEGNVVEVTHGNPHYWGTSLALQMISSGSAWLYAARKGQGILRSFQRLPLSDIITRFCSPEDVEEIESRVPAAMRQLRQFADEGLFDGGKAYSISFKEGEMKLEETTQTSTMFPPKSVVDDLLRSAKGSDDDVSS